MYDTSTVFGSYIVTRNYAESLVRSFFPTSVFRCFNWFHPRNKLFIFHANQICSFILTYYFERNQLVARFIIFQRHAFCFFIEMSIKQRLCKHYGYLLSIICIVSLYSYIINLRAHTQSCIRRQCPRSSCPCDEIRCAPLCHLRLWIFHLELTYYSQILHITITSRLIQLMRAQSCTCGR